MNICFVDFETTGIDVFKDNPIEIGSILINEHGKVIEHFHSYIRPRNKRAFSSSAKRIHGMDKEFLESAKCQRDVLEEFFYKMGSNFRFCGWNINFDVSFFRRMCHLNNFMKEYNQINHRHVDIQSIIYYLTVNNILPKELKSLDDFIDFFKLKRNNKHSALEDAELTLEIYRRIFKINTCTKL